MLGDAGFLNLHMVAEQREPNGHFPTVRFPNPEEPGALDLVTELARHVNADLVLANDPDVDRLAASLPDADGHWTALTGNQIGVLLADPPPWLLKERRTHAAVLAEKERVKAQHES